MTHDISPQLAQQLADTTQQSVTRQGFILRVRPEKLEEYVEVHQHVWQDMRDALSAAGYRNYSLFLQPDTGTLFGYFEADNVDDANAAIAASDVNTRWQAAMAQYFVQPNGGTAEILPQYFYLA